MPLLLQLLLVLLLVFRLLLPLLVLLLLLPLAAPLLLLQLLSPRLAIVVVVAVSPEEDEAPLQLTPAPPEEVAAGPLQLTVQWKHRRKSNLCQPAPHLRQSSRPP